MFTDTSCVQGVWR